MATISINEFNPRFSIVVYTKSGYVYDLTNDVESCTTTKSISQSSGQFTINLSGRRLYGVAGVTPGARWTDVITPLDYIEIQGSPDGSRPLSMIMRGVVNSPTESVNFGPTGGPPEPLCVISGSDMTYLLMMWQVIYMWTISSKGALAENYPTLGLYLNYGFPLYTKSFEDLLNNFKKGMVEPVVKNYREFIPKFDGFKYINGMQGNVGISLMTVNSQNGPYWSFLQYYASPPFGECFVEDFDDSSYIVVRFPPYTDIYGTMENPSKTPSSLFNAVQLNTANIRNLQLGRTDADQYTYFFTYGDASQVKGANNAVFVSNQPRIGKKVKSTSSSANPIWKTGLGSLYGPRALLVDTPLVQIYDLSSLTSKQPLSDATINTNFQQEALELNTWLYHVMKDNADFVQGQMEVEGSADYRVGINIEIPQSNQTFYLSAVQHTITGPGSAEPDWNSQLSLVRGRALDNSGPIKIMSH